MVGMKLWVAYLAGLTGGVLSIVGGVRYLPNSQAFMPSEYKTIKRVVNQLALNNDLGDQPITFSVNTGAAADWIAEELNLCKEDKCTFYSEINPFKPYQGKSSQDINEVIRQSYLKNGIEAAAWPHGLITISRSTFPSYKGKDDYLSCVIGHELSHFLNNDVFADALREGREGKRLKEKKRELLASRISRESESKADINASQMVINSGMPRDTCLKAYDFFAKHEGTGEETKADSSHPGYEDRYAALSEFLEGKEGTAKDELAEGTTGQWKYNRGLNTLVFTPD